MMEDMWLNHESDFHHYIRQVLANEWPGDADLEALKAGSIAIRTFADRERPCGTFVGQHCFPPCYHIVYNRNQVYDRVAKGVGEPQFMTITQNHIDAQSLTSFVQLKRDDGGLACAKYNRDVGHPTQSCYSANCTSDTDDQETLQSVWDPVWPTPDDPIAVGKGQRASAAWARGTAPWDYRQILTHYYVKSDVINNNLDDYYRWT